MPPPSLGDRIPSGNRKPLQMRNRDAVEASLGLDRPTRGLISQELRNEGFDPGRDTRFTDDIGTLVLRHGVCNGA